MTTERIIMGLLILGVAWGCALVIAPFLSVLLWAGILAYVTWPAFVWFRTRTGVVPAVILMSLLCATGLLVPIWLIASAGISAGPAAIESVVGTFFSDFHLPSLPEWIIKIPGIGAELQKKWGQTANDIRYLSEIIRPYAGDITESVFSLLVRLASGGLHLVMAVFITVFFWLSGDSLGKTISALFTRIAHAKAPHILSVIGGTIRGTVYGVLGTALIQGILTALGFAVMALPEPVLFGAIAAFLAVLPIGAPLVWIPGAIWLAMSHHLWKGIILAIYGIVIISGADHFIRPAFIARGAQMPYLLTLIGMIGGILEFGGLGIFLGPVFLAVGYTLTVEFATGGQRPVKADSKQTEKPV